MIALLIAAAQPVYPCGSQPLGAIECYDRYGRMVTPQETRMPTLREMIEKDPAKRFRVKIGENLFRDNKSGDRLPEGDANYGLPPENK